MLLFVRQRLSFNHQFSCIINLTATWGCTPARRHLTTDMDASAGKEQAPTNPPAALGGGVESEEGAPETGMHMPERAIEEGAATTHPTHGVPGPQAGHDPKLPDNAGCPPGYSCNDDES